MYPEWGLYAEKEERQWTRGSSEIDNWRSKLAKSSSSRLGPFFLIALESYLTTENELFSLADSVDSVVDLLPDLASLISGLR
jgi:hypothetical protein